MAHLTTSGFRSLLELTGIWLHAPVWGFMVTKRAVVRFKVAETESGVGFSKTHDEEEDEVEFMVVRS